MSRILTIGDIHGNHKALLQCLERSNFDKEKDTLIQLGDICDGYSYVKDCVDTLMTIPNLITVKGNHDDWFVTWLETGAHPVDWEQGALGTLKSYANKDTKWSPKPLPDFYPKHYGDKSKGYITNLNYADIPEDHVTFFRAQNLYYLDDERNLFIHGGFNRHFTLKEQLPYIYFWDRDLLMCALSASSSKNKLKFKEQFKNIFIGHTSTMAWKTDKPIFADIVIDLDTGAGWGDGRLTIMDITTKEYWQSDLSATLYLDEQGRN